MLATLAPILEGRRSQPHLLIEVLHDIQKDFGGISPDAIRVVSTELGVPLMEVFRVVNFYRAFTLVPKGKNVLTLCMGTACHVRGSNPLLELALNLLDLQPGETTPDGLFTVEAVNCVGACALAPVVIHNGVYYPHMTPAKLQDLIKRLKEEDGEAEDA